MPSSQDDVSRCLLDEGSSNLVREPGPPAFCSRRSLSLTIARMLAPPPVDPLHQVGRTIALCLFPRELWQVYRQGRPSVPWTLLTPSGMKAVVGVNGKRAEQKRERLQHANGRKTLTRFIWSLTRKARRRTHFLSSFPPCPQSTAGLVSCLLCGS